MDSSQTTLHELVRDAKCVCNGFDAIHPSDQGHLATYCALVRGYARRSDVTLLAEPSLARNADRPPDIVVVDRATGVHVLEVKGVDLTTIERICAGELQIRRRGRQTTENPIAQVRRAMFGVKNTTQHYFGGEMQLPFHWWVVLASIDRAAMQQKFHDSLSMREVIYKDDLEGTRLATLLTTTGSDYMARRGLKVCPSAELDALWRAFGDSHVLYDDRRTRAQARESTLGEHFNELAVQEKRLSEEQQRLAESSWRGGPRLVRGVAGSGKTIVLSTNLARRVAARIADSPTLIPGANERESVLAVCFNRTLVPFIRDKIRQAFRQRTGTDLPSGAVEVTHLNGLVYSLANRGLWTYRPVRGTTAEARARGYLAELASAGGDLANALRYTAIYLDEAQDFVPEELLLLRSLCAVAPGGEPEMFIFYDDAQNVYGRPRPVWDSLGINVKGRSHVMVECFRNTRQIVELAFNVLLGVASPNPQDVRTRTFADVNYLEKERGVIALDGSMWRVKFAERTGDKPQVIIGGSPSGEWSAVEKHLRWLLADQDVRPSDILVMGPKQEDLESLALFLSSKDLPVRGMHLPFREGSKDEFIARENHLTLSTVHSAKGYDASAVLLVGADRFDTSTEGRATFYVGCTRAREHLVVFAAEAVGLAAEAKQLVPRLAPA